MNNGVKWSLRFVGFCFGYWIGYTLAKILFG